MDGWRLKRNLPGSYTMQSPFWAADFWVRLGADDIVDWKKICSAAYAQCFALPPVFLEKHWDRIFRDLYARMEMS